MANFHGIQNILSRIQTIQSRFKPPAVNPLANSGMTQASSTSFTSALNQAMSGSGMSQMGSMNGLSGPDSLQSLLSTMTRNPQMGSLDSSASGQKLVDAAKKWEGKAFKPGETARCADFVSTMLEESGVAPTGFKHEVNCFEMQKQGKQIDKKDLKPGDIVYFGYTYLPVDYTHVGIYVGDGKVVHRPTADKPVQIDSIEQGYYAEKYSSARRLWN
jgi:cell wall-associated NlpC family hydrolase